MTSPRPELLLDLFEQAQKLPSAERADFCRERCADHTALRRELERLLAADVSAVAFLDSPLLLATAWVADTGIRSDDQTQIGPFRLDEVLGEGGMGTVYRATQEHPIRREVALKVVRPGMDSQRVVARFEAERQALARMDHPGIAKIHEAGTTPTGRPWFAMELVIGPTLLAYCDARSLPVTARLELFCQVCDAVQHAHHKGVVHRDLKPSNVLVAENDGRPQPKVIDFGIARATAEPLADLTLTRGDELVGTPDYMSPEQLARSDDLDGRADVYALGVMLYELLTSRRPHGEESFATKSLEDVRRVLRDRPPPRPSTHSRKLHGDIDAITLTALAYERERRYASVAEFAADLRRHLAHEPVLASVPGVGYRLRKFMRRHRVMVVTAGLVFASLAAGVVVAARFALDARDEALRRGAEVEQLYEALSLWEAKAIAESETMPLAAELGRLRDDLIEAVIPGFRARSQDVARGMRPPLQRVAKLNAFGELVLGARVEPRSPTAQAVVSVLASCGVKLLFDGEAAAAEPLLARGAALCDEEPLVDPRVTWVRALWYDALVANGDPEHAAHAVDDDLARLDADHLDDQHPALAIYRARRAAALTALGRLAEAEAALNAAEPVLRALYGGSYHGLQALAIRIRLEDARGDGDAAARCREELALGRSRADQAAHYAQARLVLGEPRRALWDAIVVLRDCACSKDGDLAAAIADVRRLADVHGVVPGTPAAALVGALLFDIGQGAGNTRNWTDDATLVVAREAERLLRPRDGVRHQTYAWSAALVANALDGLARAKNAGAAARRQLSEEAETFARRALAAAPLWPANQVQLDLVANGLIGRSLASQGRHEEAEPFLLLAYRGLVRDWGVREGNAKTAFARILASFAARGVLGEAVERLRAGHAWFEHPLTLRELARVEAAHGMTAAAAAHRARADALETAGVDDDVARRHRR